MNPGCLFRCSTCLVFLVILNLILGCSGDSSHDFPPQANQETAILRGIVLDAESYAHLEGVTITAGESSVKSDIDGNFIIFDLTRDITQTITAEAPHYKKYSIEMKLTEPEMDIVVRMVRDFDPQSEIEELIASLEDAIASDDVNRINDVKSTFSKGYVASDDEGTAFVVALGLIPADYESIFPTLKSIFEKYDDISFDFSDISVDALTAYQSTATMSLTIHVVKAETGDQLEVDVICSMAFVRGSSDWLVKTWKLDELVEIRQ